MVVKKDGPVHVQRVLIVANSDGSGGPVYKSAQPSLFADTIYMIKIRRDSPTS